MDFQNKVVVITGAGSGIGSSAAKKFGQLGAKVIVSDLDKDSARLTAEAIIDKGGIAKAIAADVTNNHEVAQMIYGAVEQYSAVDILVCSAGIINTNLIKTSEHSIKEWDKIIAVNQSGTFFAMKYALQQMTKQGHGNIVNVASLAGLKASKYNFAYTASKFAVVGMTKSAALEYAHKNIRINCVCPSYTKSPMLDSVVSQNRDIDEKLLSHIPMSRFAKTSEIAEAILWLASDKTAYITGQSITLDGGISL